MAAAAGFVVLAKGARPEAASARAASQRNVMRAAKAAHASGRPSASRAASQGSTALPAARTARRLPDLALHKRITQILKADGFAGEATGVLVYDLSSAQLLYARDARTPLLPASNEKLITSATALADWGAAHRFTTDLYESGALEDQGVFRGALYLKGYGDPSLSSAWYQTHVLHLRTARLSDFLSALKEAGIRKIEGHIVGDKSYFDGARTVSAWTPGMSVNCGPLSALSLNEGVEPDGQRASDPALFAARALTELLRGHGIAVSGGPRLGSAPAGATLLYSARSAPLSAIIAAMNKPSDDFFAEMLTKGLGAAFGGVGSTAAGVAVERAFLVSEGLSPQDFALSDGSGLSYADHETALDITQLLTAMSRRSDWRLFWRSLSVAGVNGTLADRMRGTPAQGNLHGKTGTLAVASNLSGYVTSANGHWLVFSMLMNSRRLDLGAAYAAQDAIGVALARARPASTIVWRPSPVLGIAATPRAAAAPAGS